MKILNLLLLVFSFNSLFSQWSLSGDDYINTNLNGNFQINTNVGDFKGGITVDKTNNSFQGKNLALFFGDASSDSNPDENINIGLVQKTNQNNNYGLITFFNYLGQQAGYLGMRYVNHDLRQTEFVFGNANGGKPSSQMIIKPDGNVGIGTLNPDSKLSVNGPVKSEEIAVVADVADYVFEESYDLIGIEDLEKYINENGYLPNIQNRSDLRQNEGYLYLGQMATDLQAKVEELTLYIIDLNKRIKALESDLSKRQ